MERRGVSAMLRVRDEEQTLELALESVRLFADQIVVVDNGSKDKSLEIAKKFKEKYKLDNMIVESFNDDPKKFECTLADLYNFTLNLTTGKWVIKWDGDWTVDCAGAELIKKAIAKYDNDEKVDGLYLINRMVFRNLHYIFRGTGDEAGILRWTPKLCYITNYSAKAMNVGESLFKQSSLQLAGDLIKEPIWHWRIKSSEDYVKSRFLLEYYHLRPAMSFEDYIIKKMGKYCFEGKELEILEGNLLNYDPKQYGLFPDDVMLKLNIGEYKKHECFDQFDENNYMQDELSGAKNKSRDITIKWLKEIEFDSILDIPCGLGVDYKLFKDAGLLEDTYYLGMDFTKKFADYCRAKHGMNVMLGRITNIPIGDKTFDVVHARGILEHLDGEEWKTAISELFRVAKKYVIISFFRGCGSERKKAVNTAGLIEQDYPEKEIIEQFGGRKFEKATFKAQNWNTYTIYKIAC